MKKNFATGLIAVGLIVAGGTGAYVAYAKDNTVEAKASMQQKMDSSQMTEMMNGVDTSQMAGMMKDMDSEQMSDMMKDMISEQMSDMMKDMDSEQMVDMMKDMDSEQMADMMKNMDSEQMKDMMKSVDMEEMQKLMQSKDFSFEKILPYMKKIHPNLSDEELKTLFENMHGKNGSSHCGNMQEKTETKNTSAI